jgi:sarcosine oxidase, subunit gamma
VPDYRLKPLLPLGGASPRVDTFAGLTITENADAALASLACRLGRETDFAAATQALFGFAMPGPGRSAQLAPYCVLWTAPGQWFVEAPLGTHEDIARILKDAFRDTASITEQTDAWVRFDVDGPRVADVFERLCALDLRKLQAGEVSRTLIEHLGCLVVCWAPGLRLSVLGPRSAARSLNHAIVTAARSAL